MPKNSEYLEYVLEQLSGLPNVTSRRMFSGAGFYQDDVFFGLLFSDTLYLKVNDVNRADYESRGMQRFKPYKDKPHLSFTYYEVPAEVLEDRDQLLAWAQKSVRAAVEIALEKQAKKRQRPKAKRVKTRRTKTTADRARSNASVVPRTAPGRPTGKPKGRTTSRGKSRSAR